MGFLANAEKNILIRPPSNLSTIFLPVEIRSYAVHRMGEEKSDLLKVLE